MNWSSLKPADRAAIKLQHLHFGGLTIGAIRLRDWRYVKSGKGYTWEGVESAPKRPIAQPIKAHKMRRYPSGYISAGSHPSDTKPIYILPATKETYEQMLDQAATAGMDHDYGRGWESARRFAAKAFAAIGI